MAERHICEEQVHSERFLTSRQCENWAVVQRDSAWYCRIHDPEYIAQKHREREAEWAKKWSQQEASRARMLALRELGEGFDTALLRRNTQTIREFIETLRGEG